MKLREILERFKSTWQNMSSGRKTGLMGFIVFLVTLLLVYYFVFVRVTYVTLFNNLDDSNSGKIVKKLEESGVTDFKITNGGGTILVPEKKVDRLRIDLAMDGALPMNGTGFEIFDSSSFAVTSEERKIQYQRALQGELERTISSLEEVEFSRVHLSLPTETVFSREKETGSASVILKLNTFEELDNEQIRAVVALVSGAVKGIPEENVRVVDSNANLLSASLKDENGLIGIGGIADRLEMKRTFENEIESQLKTMLERTLGKGKVEVSVNAVLNYDSEEATSILYDKDNNVIRSEQQRLLIDSDSEAQGGSPVDNNLQYYALTSYAAINGLNTFENIKNYEISETTTRVLKAPGELLRLTTSVVFDGNLDAGRKESIRNLVVGAVGYDETRNDIINIEAMVFDRTYEDELTAEMETLTATIIKKEKTQGYINLGLKGLGGIFTFLMFIIFLRKMKKQPKLVAATGQNVNISVGTGAVGETVNPVGVEEVFESISLNLERESATEHKENEVNEFVEKDPDRVAEIVKTWILKEEG